MVASTQRIRGFDGLRAIAFLLVFVSHKVPVPVTEGYGTAGVWLFFVLSGFLITRIMLHSRLAIEQRGESQLSHLMDFWVRRSLRIFPVYYAFLASMTLLSLVKPINLGTPIQQLSNFLFFSNVYIEFHGWPGRLGHLWSLSVEEQFYILFAPMALDWLRLQLGYICAGILLVSVIAHAVLLAEGSWSVSFDVNSFVNFGLMAIGGLAGLRANRALPKLLGGDIAICINFCTILVIPLLMSSVWPQFGRVTGLLMALLLMQIYQKQNGWFVTVLNSPPLRRLGVVSYGAYLFHVVINVPGALARFGYVSEYPLFTKLFFDLAVTIILAELSWRFLESPLRALVKNKGTGVLTKGQHGRIEPAVAAAGVSRQPSSSPFLGPTFGDSETL